MEKVAVWRWVLAFVVLAGSLYLALLAGFAFGTFYFADEGPDRLREQAGFLLVASGLGLAGMAAFLIIAGRRRLSLWLLVGLVPAAVAASNHLGLTG